MVNVPAIPISGYGRILPSPPSCANSASGGVNSSFMCIWNTDFTADGLQVGIRNYGSAASKTDVTARVLYVKSGYYDSP